VVAAYVELVLDLFANRDLLLALPCTGILVSSPGLVDALLFENA
jgi:hypothetical protein